MVRVDPRSELALGRLPACHPCFASVVFLPRPILWPGWKPLSRRCYDCASDRPLPGQRDHRAHAQALVSFLPRLGRPLLGGTRCSSLGSRGRAAARSGAQCAFGPCPLPGPAFVWNEHSSHLLLDVSASPCGRVGRMTLFCHVRDSARHLPPHDQALPPPPRSCFLTAG